MLTGVNVLGVVDIDVEDRGLGFGPLRGLAFTVDGMRLARWHEQLNGGTTYGLICSGTTPDGVAEALEWLDPDVPFSESHRPIEVCWCRDPGCGFVGARIERRSSVVSWTGLCWYDIFSDDPPAETSVVFTFDERAYRVVLDEIRARCAQATVLEQDPKRRFRRQEPPREVVRL